MIEIKTFSDYKVPDGDANISEILTGFELSRNIARGKLVVSDTLDELSNVLSPKITADNVKDGSKVFINGDSPVPPLIINNLNTKVKRVSSFSRANLIVTDLLLNTFNDVYFTVFNPENNNLFRVYFSAVTSEIKAFVSQHPELEVFYSKSVSDEMMPFVEASISGVQFISSAEFTAYLEKYMPKIEEEELDTVITLIKSSDPESYQTVVNLLQYMSIADCRWQIVNAINLAKLYDIWHKAQKSKAGVFLFSRLNLKPSDFRGSYWEQRNPSIHRYIKNMLWYESHRLNVFKDSRISIKLRRKYYADLLLKEMTEWCKYKRYSSFGEVPSFKLVPVEDTAVNDLTLTKNTNTKSLDQYLYCINTFQDELDYLYMTVVNDED